jgi:Flp pilus assembly protein TadD
MKIRTQSNVVTFGILAALGLAGCTQLTQLVQPGAGPAPIPMGPGTVNLTDAPVPGGDQGLGPAEIAAAPAGDPDSLIHQGDSFYALGRCDQAVPVYQLALKSDPKSTAAELGLGRCLLKTDPVAAEAALTLATADDPGNAAAYNDLGIARDLQGNFAGAVDPYQRALAADPSVTATQINLGMSLALSGNGPAALEYLQPLATGPATAPKIREDYAAALLAAGQPAQARAVLAIDLTTDQVNAALAGYAGIIAGAEAKAAAAAAAGSATAGGSTAAPTTASVSVTSVAATPLPVTPPPPPSPPTAPPGPLNAAGDFNAAVAHAAPLQGP